MEIRKIPTEKINPAAYNPRKDLQPAQIAEALHCDERTFYRYKNRLVNKLKVVLFGADAL